MIYGEEDSWEGNVPGRGNNLYRGPEREAMLCVQGTFVFFQVIHHRVALDAVCGETCESSSKADELLRGEKAETQLVYSSVKVVKQIIQVSFTDHETSLDSLLKHLTGLLGLDI